MAKDPVCGMDVDPKTAAGKSEYKGQTYYFCSAGCKRSFDKDPERIPPGRWWAEIRIVKTVSPEEDAMQLFGLCSCMNVVF